MGIAQNRDVRPIANSFNEPVLLCGRFAGNSSANVIPVTGANKSGLVVSRTGTGAHTVTLPTPTGTIQAFDAWVNSPNNAKTVLVAPWSAGATTVNVTVAWSTNSAAVDLQTYEELDVWGWLAASQYP